MKRFFKLITLAIPVLGVALSFTYHPTNIKPALVSASDTAIYGTNSQPGYFSSSETSSFNPTHYTKANGFYYPGMINDFEGVFIPTLSTNSISIRAPFIAPYIADGYQHRYGLYQSVYAGEVPWVDANDVWYTSDVSNDMQPYLDKTGITFTGVPLGSTTSETIPVSSVTSQVSSGNRVSVQGLVINSSTNLYNYSSITLNLGTVKYVSMVESYKEEEGLYSLNYETEIIPSTYTTFSFSPSSQGVISGSEVTNLTNEAIWYEGPYENDTRRSFINKSTLKTYLKNTLTDYITTSPHHKTYTPTGFVFTSEAFSNPFGNDVTLSEVKAYRESDFSLYGEYNIWLVPYFASTPSDLELNHNISKLEAIHEDDVITLEKILDEQVELLIKECSVFSTIHPATAFSEAESVMFSQYEFRSSPSVSNSKEAEGTYYSLSDSANGVNFKIPENTATPLTKGQTLYSFQNRNINGTWDQWKHIFNVGEIDDWSKTATAAGTSTFVAAFNTLFDGSTTAYYVADGSEDNYVTFHSRDKLFIKITKDNVEKSILTASTTYSTPNNNKATATPVDSSPFYFSEPGTYKIEMRDRCGNTITPKYLHIFDKNDISLTPAANNNELNLTVNVPNGSSLKDLKIFYVPTTEHTDVHSYVEEVNPPLTQGQRMSIGFEGLETDSDSESISKNTKTYRFEQKGTYYIEVNVLDTTKAFYVYYNYIEPEPEPIDPDPTPIPTPTPDPEEDSSSETPGDSSETSSETTSSESPTSETPSSEPSSSSEVTPTPEDLTNSNATAVIIIIAAVGVVIIGTLVFVIIRARKTGRMKK